ncbi:hypothetical protein [Achromobacter sp. AGC25]
MTKLCREYGLSDNGLRKICKALSIPTPRAGHWTKIEAGKPVAMPALPLEAAQASYVLELPEKSDADRPERKDRPDASAQNSRIRRETDESMRIVLPPPGRWHKALIPFRDGAYKRVKEWREEEKIYEASRARKASRTRSEPAVEGFRWKMFLNEGGFIFPKHRSVAARVTLNTYERGLALLNALCFAADARGFVVEATTENSDSIRFRIDDVPIRLRVGERTGYNLFHEDGPPSENGMGFRRQTKPKGDLRIYCWVLYSNDKVLDEADGSPWEGRLSEVFLYLYRAVARAKEKILSIQVAEEQRRLASARREEEQRAQELERQDRSSVRADQMRKQQASLERERTLLDEVARWKHACDLRAYIEHIERQTGKDMGGAEWLCWARDVLERLDPAPRRIMSCQQDG